MTAQQPRNHVIFRASGQLATELDRRKTLTDAARGAVAKRDLSRIYPLAALERARLFALFYPEELAYLADVLYLDGAVNEEAFIARIDATVAHGKYRRQHRIGNGQGLLHRLMQLSPLQLWVLVDTLEREWQPPDGRAREPRDTPDPAMERLEKSYPFRGEHVLP